MKLAVVIVHYNTSADLDRCLASLEAYPPAAPWRIVVVDNASRDEGLADVHRRHPDCEWIFSTENEGYARGCNRGMARVDAEYYLVLNPDVVVQPGALDSLLAFADAHPRAGIVGPQLLNEDGSVQHSCRRFYTLGTLLLRRTFLGRLFPDSRTVRRHLMLDFDHATSRPVDWVLGGCMLARRSAVARTGPMDERFFLYFEDVDWCYRMWRAGFEVLYSPDARFVHRHRRSSAQRRFDRTFWSHLTSLISFYEKWGMLVWLLKKWRDPLLLALLWLLDMGALAAAFGLAYGLRAAGSTLFAEDLYPFAEYRPLLLFGMLLTTVTFLLSGRYRAGHLRRRRPAVEHAQQVGVAAVLLLAATYLGHQEVASRAVLLLFVPLAAVLTAAAERLLLGGLRRLESGRLSLERTLLVGAPGPLRAWLAEAGDLAAAGVDVAGYLAAAPPVGALPPLADGAVPWLGAPGQAAEVAERYRISQVVFWSLPAATDPVWPVVGALRRMRVRLRWHADGVWLLAARAHVEIFGGALSAVQSTGGRRAVRAAVRRALGLAAGLVLGIAGAPARLALRLAPGRGGRTRLTVRDRWGRVLDLTLAVDASGRPRALPWQAALAGPLLRGHLALWGERAHVGDHAPTPADARELLEFWMAEPTAPGLTGPWAGATVGARWRRLWQDPGGFGTVTRSAAWAAGPATGEAPGGEVGEPCEHDS